MKIATPEHCPLQEKFALTRKELSDTLIERDAEIDLVLTGLVAQENVLLVGPPGCAKSLLLDSLLAWMNGRRFSILLNRFTCPEELLGPISVTGLKSDCYRRVTTGKLPEADLAFLDEVWKASDPQRPAQDPQRADLRGRRWHRGQSSAQAGDRCLERVAKPRDRQGARGSL